MLILMSPASVSICLAISFFLVFKTNGAGINNFGAGLSTTIFFDAASVFGDCATGTVFFGEAVTFLGCDFAAGGFDVGGFDVGGFDVGGFDVGGFDTGGF